MTTASSEKWRRYEQALLAAMGFDQFPAVSATATYQLLIVPAFRAPCCLRLTLADQEGEISVGMLVDRYADLFDAAWRESSQAAAAATRSARRACLEDIADLNAEQAAALRKNLAMLDPATLSDVDLAARDGVSLRCDCHERATHHTFGMRSPTAAEAPRHAALCQLFLEAARAHFRHPQIQEHLAAIASYFH